VAKSGQAGSDDKGRSQLVGILCLWLLAAPLARWAWDRTAALPRSGDGRAVTEPLLKIRLAPARSPSGWALREARVEWIRARLAAARELERSPELETGGVGQHLADVRRQQLMALDRTGALRCALRAALCAAALARTPAERWQATELLSRLECDAGRRQTELRLARQLVAWAPGQRPSWEALKHAAACNGDSRLIRKADAALARLPLVP
jgi:hypothetical protein